MKLDMSRLERKIVYAKVYDVILNEYYQFRVAYDEGYISTSEEPFPIIPVEPREGTETRKWRRKQFMDRFLLTGVL